MKSTWLALGAAAIFGAPLAAPAAIVTLDFESVAGSPSISLPYVEDGFSVSTVAGFGAFIRQPGDAAYLGSAALTPAVINAEIRVAAVDGSLFNLLSLDMGLSPAFEGTGGETPFFAILSDGSMIVEAKPRANAGFTTYDFPTFTGITAFGWFNAGFTAIQLDNVVLEVPDVIVPEPGTLGLAVFGLAALGLARQRRIRSSTLR